MNNIDNKKLKVDILKPNKIISIYNINNITNKEIELVKKTLPERYNHSLVYHGDDFKRSLAGNILLINNIDNIKDENIYYNNYKKPLLKDMYFNISHSNDLVAFIKDNNIVGIDIEYIKKVDFKIVNKVFSEFEIQYINNNYEKFFYLWTIKESIIKAIGKGLSINLKIIDSLSLLNGKSIIIDQIELFTKTIKYENYIISVTSTNPISDILILQK